MGGSVASMRGHAAILVQSFLLVAACGGDDLTLPSKGAPALTIIGGDQQSATVGEFVPEPVIVQLIDGAGNPIAGATVSFQFDASVPGAEVSPSAPATDERGEAGANARLGTQAGGQALQAQVTMPAGDLQVVFRLTALAKPGGDDSGSAGPPPGGGGDPPGDGGGGGNGGNGGNGGDGNGGNSGGGNGGNDGGGHHHDNGGGHHDQHDDHHGGHHHENDDHGHHGNGGGRGQGGDEG